MKIHSWGVLLCVMAVGFGCQLKEKKLDQAVHGNDYWQTDYDGKDDSYRMSFNLPLDDLKKSEWVLKKNSSRRK